MAGKRVGLVLSGGNIDREMLAEVLAGRTPQA
jgi:threonine dehydratase